MFIFRTVVYYIFFQLAGSAGAEKAPLALLMILAFTFYDLVVHRPIFPYPDGKVTWPWKGKQSGKS